MFTWHADVSFATFRKKKKKSHWHYKGFVGLYWVWVLAIPPLVWLGIRSKWKEMVCHIANSNIFPSMAFTGQHNHPDRRDLWFYAIYKVTSSLFIRGQFWGALIASSTVEPSHLHFPSSHGYNLGKHHWGWLKFGHQIDLIIGSGNYIRCTLSNLRPPTSQARWSHACAKDRNNQITFKRDTQASGLIRGDVEMWSQGRITSPLAHKQKKLVWRWMEE